MTSTSNSATGPCITAQAPSGEWIEFEGTSNTRPVLDGSATSKTTSSIARRRYARPRDARLRPGDGHLGHLVDRLAARRTARSIPPVKGRFENGVGNFYSDGDINGKPMRTRYTWSQITKTSARWEQAYSYDAGKTWETNWVMEFKRVKWSGVLPLAIQSSARYPRSSCACWFSKMAIAVFMRKKPNFL